MKSRMSADALMKTGDQFKGIDSYLLKDYEHESEDGKFLICDICGKAKAERKTSKIFSKDYWSPIERQGRAFVPVLTGCSCQQNARHRISERKDGRWVESVDKNGKQVHTFVSGSLAEEIYNNKRYTYSVPYKHVGQWIESKRFWGLSDEESRYSYQTIRNMLEGVFVDGDECQSYVVYGGENAIAMMCAVRNALISYGFPAIMMDTKTTLFHRSNGTPMSDELDSVQFLLMILNDQLSASGSEVIKDLLSLRTLRPSTRTMFCSTAETIEEFSERVGDDVFAEIYTSVGGERNFLKIRDTKGENNG